MEVKMKSIINWLDNQSKLVKILLALPFLDIIWVVYRLLKSLDSGNVIGIILAIVLIVIGIPFLWLIDMICIALMDKVFWIE